MGQMIKLSIIVPVYNAERYLSECINSIITQTYSDIEIILVNDGSTDSSYEICKEYENVDERICVINQTHKGLLSARLNGVQMAHGEYIGFVDSDDWIAEDMYEILLSGDANGNGYDIASVGYISIQEEIKAKGIENLSLFGIFEGKNMMDIFLSRMMYDIQIGKRGIQPSLCTKIIKKELILMELLRIDKRITLGEDAAVFYPCCLRANSINIISKNKYFYRIHSDSMCRSMEAVDFERINFFNKYMKRIMNKHDDKYDLLGQLKKYTWEFIEQGLEQVFNVRVESIYQFPYALVEPNSDIVLYGAGKVGQAFYDQIQRNFYCNIVAWIDKNKCENIVCTISPERIRDFRYNKVVIAIKNKETANEIIEELTGLGVDPTQIIWEAPLVLPVQVL